MKPIFKYISLSFLLGAMSVSCTDMLVEEPHSILTDSAIQTEEDLNATVNGIYNAITMGVGNASIWKTFMPVNGWGMMGTDMWELLPTQSGEGTKYSRYSFTPDSKDVKSAWLQLYTIIDRANTVIDIAKTINLPEKVTRTYVAEAKFLRAFAYFELVKYFGGVPLRLTRTLTVAGDSDVKRSTEQEVYNQIFDDLMASVNVLPSQAAPGRATKWAAKALLAKAYLSCGGYPVNNYDDKQYFVNAAKKAYEVIKNSGKTLNPTTPGYPGAFLQYGKQFLESGENSNESIFELQFQTGAYGGAWGYRSVSSGMRWDKSDYGNYFYYYGGHRISSDFALSFNDDDIRFQWSISPYNVTPTGRNEQMINAWTPAKYRVENQPGDSFDNSVNFIYCRLAEVYLIYAEAYNEAYGSPIANNGDGMDMTAFDAINKVRERAQVDEITLDYLNANPTWFSYDSAYKLNYNMSLQSFDNLNENYSGRHVYYQGTTEQERFRDAVLMERLWELCFEGHRWFDLKRTGRLREMVKGANLLTKGKLASVQDPIDKSNFANDQLPEKKDGQFFDAPNYIDKENVFYLPIPNHEIAYNGLIGMEDQNPGY